MFVVIWDKSSAYGPFESTEDAYSWLDQVSQGLADASEPEFGVGLPKGKGHFQSMGQVMKLHDQMKKRPR